MARCEDCIHYEVCYDRSYSADWCKVRNEVEKHCEYFKDDSCLKKQIPGKWVCTEHEGETVYICPECKEEWVTIEGTAADNLWYYCPHCGKRLTEGEENDRT